MRTERRENEWRRCSQLLRNVKKDTVAERSLLSKSALWRSTRFWFRGSDDAGRKLERARKSGSVRKMRPIAGKVRCEARFSRKRLHATKVKVKVEVDFFFFF